MNVTSWIFTIINMLFFYFELLPGCLSFIMQMLTIFVFFLSFFIYFNAQNQAKLMNNLHALPLKNLQVQTSTWFFCIYVICKLSLTCIADIYFSEHPSQTSSSRFICHWYSCFTTLRQNHETRKTCCVTESFQILQISYFLIQQITWTMIKFIITY